MTRIPLFQVLMAPETMERLAQLLTPRADGSLYIGQGERVEELEGQLGAIYGRPVITTNSGTAAIDLALELIGVGPGDLVLTPAVNCTAGTSSIVMRRAIPVWADVDPVTGLIDPADVRRKLIAFRQRPVKAVMAVDWSGRSCDFVALKALGAEFGVPVIEDAAHRGPEALPESGDYVVFSFQAIKFLTAGDGGALACPDLETTEQGRLLRWYGLDRRSSASFRCAQNVQRAGTKWHMNDIAATIALANLPASRAALQQQKLRAWRYADWFKELRLEAHGVAAPPPCATSSWWIYTMLVQDRSAFEQFMASRAIDTSQVHARNDRHDAFHFPIGSLPGTDFFAERQESIPVGHWLSDEDEARVIETVRDYADGRR